MEGIQEGGFEEGEGGCSCLYDAENVGAIHGRPGRERVADAQSLRSLAYTLARQGMESLREAYLTKPRGAGRRGG